MVLAKLGCGRPIFCYLIDGPFNFKHGQAPFNLVIRVLDGEFDPRACLKTAKGIAEGGRRAGELEM